VPKKCKKKFHRFFDVFFTKKKKWKKAPDERGKNNTSLLFVSPHCPKPGIRADYQFFYCHYYFKAVKRGTIFIASSKSLLFYYR
jgi:hypothetical protein